MNLIKLDAIDSTNDYLKLCNAENDLPNFTTVMAENQMAGKGQRGAVWQVEVGKNLTMSVLLKDFIKSNHELFIINQVVSVAVFNVLSNLEIPQLKIKWPNDIMSGNKKIGGVLIENTLKNGGEVISIIGIGINVNQINFADLPKASSIYKVTGLNYDKELLGLQLVSSIKTQVEKQLMNPDSIYNKYESILYKYNVPMAFEDINQNHFMGIIKGVKNTGLLKIQLEDKSEVCFNLKEVKMLY